MKVKMTGHGKSISWVEGLEKFPKPNSAIFHRGTPCKTVDDANYFPSPSQRAMSLPDIGKTFRRMSLLSHESNVNGVHQRPATTFVRDDISKRRASVMDSFRMVSAMANKTNQTLMSKIKRHVRSIYDLNPFQTPVAEATQPAPVISSSLRIFVGTWNMHGMIPSDLSPFIPAMRTDAGEFNEAPNRIPGSVVHPSAPKIQIAMAESLQLESDSDPSKLIVDNIREEIERDFPKFEDSLCHPFHVMAIGTQECQKSISEAVVFPSKAEWERKVNEVYGKHYELVVCETMGALHLCVMVWKKCTHLISSAFILSCFPLEYFSPPYQITFHFCIFSSFADIETSCVPTGIGGMVGNKGGVGIAITIGATKLLFVNLHLTGN
jgi:hypothetical protein